MSAEKICTVDGCDRRWRTRRMCDAHYGAYRRRMLAYGRWGTGSYTDATPVRDHIQALSAAGVSWKRLHQLSGVPLSSIGRIVIGRTERGEAPPRQVMQHVADRILAVPMPSVWWRASSDGRPGDQSGTARRLQALVAIGYTQSELARRLGILETNAGRLVHGRTLVAAETARRVASLYDELAMIPGTSAQARALAKRNGWLPPLDWDDEAIDDPAGLPSMDTSTHESRSRMSRWWRSLPCEVEDCDKTRVGLGRTVCGRHMQVSA